MILCNINYKHEYRNDPYNNKISTMCTPICNKLIMVFDLSNILDNITISKLDSSLEELYTN